MPPKQTLLWPGEESPDLSSRAARFQPIQLLSSVCLGGSSLRLWKGRLFSVRMVEPLDAGIGQESRELRLDDTKLVTERIQEKPRTGSPFRLLRAVVLLQVIPNVGTVAPSLPRRS